MMEWSDVTFTGILAAAFLAFCLIVADCAGASENRTTDLRAKCIEAGHDPANCLVLR